VPESTSTASGGSKRLDPRLLYALMQIPDLILMAALLVVARQLEWISTSVASVAFGVWLLKDVLMYRFVAPALGAKPLLGAERMIGDVGAVVHELAPEGWIKLRGERWRAVSRSGPIPEGASVVVHEVRGLTLWVSAVEPSANASD